MHILLGNVLHAADVTPRLRKSRRNKKHGSRFCFVSLLADRQFVFTVEHVVKFTAGADFRPRFKFIRMRNGCPEQVIELYFFQTFAYVRHIYQYIESRNKNQVFSRIFLGGEENSSVETVSFFNTGKRKSRIVLYKYIMTKFLKNNEI